MKTFLILTVVVMSAVCYADDNETGEVVANPWNQTQDAGIGLCFDKDLCVNSGMRKPVPPTQDQLKAWLDKCLTEKSNRFIKILEDNRNLKSDSQVFRIEEVVAEQYCTREKYGLDLRAINEVRTKVQNHLIKYWIDSRGA